MISPDVKVLILSMHRDKEYMYHAISAGAEGYILKEDAYTELFVAVEKIIQCGRYISSVLSRELTDELVKTYRKGPATTLDEFFISREPNT